MLPYLFGQSAQNDLTPISEPGIIIAAGRVLSSCQERNKPYDAAHAAEPFDNPVMRNGVADVGYSSLP